VSNRGASRDLAAEAGDKAGDLVEAEVGSNAADDGEVANSLSAGSEGANVGDKGKTKGSDCELHSEGE
jgi:hypothetical protein